MLPCGVFLGVTKFGAIENPIVERRAHFVNLSDSGRAIESHELFQSQSRAQRL
jgi:hypothetical protein